MIIRFKALGDPTRQRILGILKDRDLTATEISKAFSMSAPSTSHHLDRLQRAGLVSSRKRGHYITYTRETTVLDETVTGIFRPMKKVVLEWLRKTLRFIEPRKRPARSREDPVGARLARLARPALLLGLIVTVCAQMSDALGYPIPLGVYALNGCLLLFVLVGNFGSNLRPNYFAGIRTPWTLANRETWCATHRIGGRIMVFGSLALIIAQFFVSRVAFISLFLAYLLGFAAWAFLYSWNHCRKLRAGR
jgi:DNA-binding transcriptional ArsR family regulator